MRGLFEGRGGIEWMCASFCHVIRVTLNPLNGEYLLMVSLSFKDYSMMLPRVFKSSAM